MNQKKCHKRLVLQFKCVSPLSIILHSVLSRISFPLTSQPAAADGCPSLGPVGLFLSPSAKCLLIEGPLMAGVLSQKS